MQFQEKVSILERKLVDKDIANGMPTGGGKLKKKKIKNPDPPPKNYFKKWAFLWWLHFLVNDSHQRHIRIIVDELEPEDDSETNSQNSQKTGQNFL